MIYISSSNGRHPVTKTFTPLNFTTLSFALTPYKFPTSPFQLTMILAIWPWSWTFKF
jgi:hypothetical protein